MKLGNAVGIPRPVSSRMGGHVSISNTGKYARFLKLELGASGFRRIPVFSKTKPAYLSRKSVEIFVALSKLHDDIQAPLL